MLLKDKAYYICIIFVETEDLKCLEEYLSIRATNKRKHLLAVKFPY